MPGRHRPKKFHDFDIDLGRTARGYNTTVLSIAETYGKVWYIEGDLQNKEYSFDRRQLINYSKYLIGECMRIIEEQGIGVGSAPRALQKIKKRFNILESEVSND